MHPKGSWKCPHCGEFFVPDARNRRRQRYCGREPCRRASKAASQRAWLSRPENRDYFCGPDNAERVRVWRKAHPGYWRKSRRRRAGALQEILMVQPAVVQGPAKQDKGDALQDLLASQPPVLVGLIAHLTGTALQEDIAAMTRRLHSRGRAVLGNDVPRPDDAKTPSRFAAGAARAAPV